MGFLFAVTAKRNPNDRFGINKNSVYNYEEVCKAFRCRNGNEHERKCSGPKDGGEQCSRRNDRSKRWYVRYG